MSTPVTDDYLQGLIATILTTQAQGGSYPTAIGANWFTPRTWRTPVSQLPIGMIETPGEMMQNQSGRTGPSDFWTTGRFQLVARLYVKDGAGDAGAIAARAGVGAIKRQVLAALINADPLRRAVQQFVSVESSIDVKTEGGFTFGELDMTLSLEYFQGEEDFAQPPSGALEEIAVYADLLNLFSPTGDFTGEEPFSVATAAPRTTGPDGRPEASMLIELPQPE